MIEVINLEKLSNDGYKQPANDPTSSTPDNITHAQLRYNTFTSSYVVQGVAVTGASSTFQFTISNTLAYSLFKLYVSTDGTTYTEKKSYGGTLGRTINLSQNAERFLYLKLKQAGTAAPTAALGNAFAEATIDYTSIDSTGVYSVYFSSNFLIDTAVSMAPQVLALNGSSTVPIGYIYITQFGQEYITFVTVDLNNTPANDLIYPGDSGSAYVYLPIKLINII